MIYWCCLCSSKVSLSCFTPLFKGRRDMVVVFSPMLLILYQCTISRFYIYKKLTFLWKKKKISIDSSKDNDVIKSNVRSNLVKL